MSLVREDPELDQPVEDLEQLVEHFRAGETPPKDWRIGTEHEKIGLLEESFEPVPFESARGIAILLEKLVRDYGHEPLLDGDAVVGTAFEGATITLEPGGQLELSGAPLLTLHETCAEFQSHLALMKHVSAECGISWLGLGIHPLADVEKVPRVPRERYAIMRDFLSQRGELASQMMHTTATVQANLDYASEADMGEKLALALRATPVVSALWANSSISNGTRNGFASRREWIWRHTDPERCGLLPFVFDDEWRSGSPYRRYTEWALDVPMLFLQRGGHHVEMGGLRFRDYLREGFGKFQPTLLDWNVHLTTLFPQVRLKRVLEMRGADAVPPGLVCALPAIWKGLLYDAEARAGLARRLGSWSFGEVDRLHVDVARRGLGAEAPDGPVCEVARQIVDLAAAGLRRIDIRNRAGEDESLFLSPLYEILDRGKSPGEQLVDLWEGPWNGRIERLVEYARY